MQLPDRPKDFYAVRSAVDRDDVTLIELLVAHGVERDDDAIYHACEHGSTAMREALWKPGAEQDVGHNVDFEDLDGLRWFIARGADMNERCCLHHGVRAPARRPPALGNPDTDGYGWILGQFALLDRVEIVRTLLDAGMDVDTRGWSNFTPLDQAAMHGRRATVELLIERGRPDRPGLGDHGPTPLDCAIWALRCNRAHDGDYVGTVEALAAAGAPTFHEPPSADPAVDRVLERHGVW